jgi:ATP-dependent exoDNAse (exonuclease V) beta subunit
MASPQVNLMDEPARRRAAHDLSRSYCVEAAAGTGKTTLLISRLLSIVRSGVELKDVAAITFTEKAAAELQWKLRRELEKGRRDPAEPARGLYAGALEQLDTASISTIHAFAAALLRERPVEARIDPGFELLEEMGSQILFDEVWQEWKQRQLQGASAVVKRLLALEISLDWAIKPVAVKLYENRDLALLDTPAPPAWRIHDVWEQIGAGAARLDALRRFCSNPGDKGYCQVEELLRLVHETPAGELDRERALFLDFKVDARLGNQNYWKPAARCKELKRVFAELQELGAAAAVDLGASLTAGVLAWLKDFLRELEKAKNARGALDFQDLLLKARDLVRDHAEVRRHFQRRFRYLLVDEFQDTDPLQAELVFLLAGEEEDRPAGDGRPPADWRTIALAPDKLFLVGDPKQSIYRFRRADIQLYEQAKQRLGARHPPLVIQQNFRSSPSLLRAVNELFAPQMIRDEYQAGYVPLEPSPDHRDPGPALAVLLPPSTYEPGTVDDYLTTEAEQVARLVRRLCDARDGPVKVRDKASQQPRPPEYGDIAVLLPINDSLRYYDRALRTADVPLQIDAGRQFYVRRETRALLSVLAAVDNPEDSIAVAAALRSPFFGLSDEDLLLHHQAQGSFNYLHRSAPPESAVTSSLAQLRRWHQLRATASLSRLVHTILDETSVLPFFVLLPGGEQAVANLLRLAELARRFETQPGACLRSFAAWLEQRAAAEAAEADVVLGDEEANALHLLTIHKAKGLEFPIVVLAGMACNRRSAKPPVLLDHGRQEIGICFNHCKTRNYDELAEKEEKRAEAEDLRLFYVAATRARDCLVIPHLAPQRTAGARFLNLFQEKLAYYCDLPEEARDKEGVLVVPADELPPMEPMDAPFHRDLGRLAPAEELVAPRLQARRAWHQEMEILGVQPPPPANDQPPTTNDQPPTEREWRARAFAQAMGTAFHAVLRQVKLEPEGTDPLLDALIRRAAAQENLATHAARLKDWVTRALGSPLLARARRARRLWRELPFCVSLEGQPKEGSIDLLFEEEGSYVLVDYKTEAVAAKDLPAAVESHRAQLAFYREAVRQLTGRYPREAFLYFVRLGTAQLVIFEDERAAVDAQNLL